MFLPNHDPSVWLALSGYAGRAAPGSFRNSATKPSIVPEAFPLLPSILSSKCTAYCVREGGKGARGLFSSQLTTGYCFAIFSLSFFFSMQDLQWFARNLMTNLLPIPCVLLPNPIGLCKVAPQPLRKQDGGCALPVGVQNVGVMVDASASRRTSFVGKVQTKLAGIQKKQRSSVALLLLVHGCSMLFDWLVSTTTQRQVGALWYRQHVAGGQAADNPIGEFGKQQIRTGQLGQM